ncbi:MAG: nucleotidyltransferase domain-containing protein, partial [Eubacterium sp.]|nr:nucleotidyltransferase domain-containing protein [Eubacterium sp.]
MLKQLEIFNKLVTEFKKDNSIYAVLLNGSVAVGTATELSDLDIVVLCNENKFVSKVIDDVFVEIHYIT